MAKKINLEQISTSPEAYAAYISFAEKAAQALLNAGLDSESIPDEEVFLESDGSLSVVVSIPGKFETKFSLPKGGWIWKS